MTKRQRPASNIKRYIVVPEDELHRRGKMISSDLKCLTGNPTGPAWKQSASSYSYSVVAHDGDVSSDPSELRFASRVPSIRCSYQERWLKDGGSPFWYLERAYLHLYTFDRAQRTETEFLLLHCDPNESPAAAHVLYKRGPHLHVKAAPDPFHRIHIALNLTDSDAVLASIDALSTALRSAIGLLSDEVLPLYPL